MTVYVDDMRARFKDRIMCHMIADDEGELHAMAESIGILRMAYQRDHYDVDLSKRALAVRAGAREITWRQAGAMVKLHRHGAPMGEPATALERWLALRDGFCGNGQQMSGVGAPMPVRRAAPTDKRGP